MNAPRELSAPTDAEVDAAVPKSRERRLENALAFFASCIRSGEPWDEICQRAYDDAVRQDALAARAVPVAWMYEHDGMVYTVDDPPIVTAKRWFAVGEPWTETPLYAHPQERK